MGTMPFHLEKGMMGLRMDYLTRSKKVRDHVYARLMSGEDPFHVASTIQVEGMNESINLFLDKKADFVRKLDLLLAADYSKPDHHARRSGEDYFKDQARLMPANNDATGNRQAFARYWFRHKDTVSEALGTALTDAIAAGKPHIDYWWECTMDEGQPPTVVCVTTPGSAHVIFVTDHEPVEPDGTGVRGDPDPDPPGMGSGQPHPHA
jgi:hypothetical protein